MTLPAQTCLYRYDLKTPPQQWSTDFHEYFFDKKGYKNKIGAFFFFDKKEIAIHSCRNDKEFDEICHLTQCETIKDVNLLNICSDMIPHILYILHNEGINILTQDFLSYGQAGYPSLSLIAKDFKDYLYLDQEKKNSPKDISLKYDLIKK